MYNNGRTVCGLRIKMCRRVSPDANVQGWDELPEDRCKRCVKIILKK